MVKPLSEDLRVRTVRAVEGGMSRRAAAERFGISVASAVRFVREWRENGTTKPKRQGGDQRSHRIEEYHDAIISAIEAKPDMTLVEISEMLKSEFGAWFAPSSIWTLPGPSRHNLQKKARTQQSRIGLMLRRRAKPGANSRRNLTLTSWSSSTRPARRPKWPGFTAAQNVANVATPRSLTVIG
ncbi:transposase [Bradyrhizobium sp. USDA 4486]